MKSLTFLSISSLAALIASTPDHWQSVSSVLCTDAPAQTVTITQPCAPCQTGVPGSGPGTGTGGNGGNGGNGGSGGNGGNGSGVGGGDGGNGGNGGNGGPGGNGGNGGVVTVTVSVTETITTTAVPDTTTTPPDISTTTTVNPPQKTFNVDVGAFKVGDSNKTTVEFRPNNITNANVGDLVLFNMLGMNHSVTQSQFAAPCVKNGSFDTGFVFNPMNISNAAVQSFTVNVTTPLWFYCRQTGHCGKGMVFGINPKSQEQMQQFIDMAKAQNGTNSTTPPPPPPNGNNTAPFATVTVGINNGTGLVFDPPVLPTVPAGSTVRFEFRARNHTLTESSFGAPCTKLEGPAAIDTGFTNANPLDIAPFGTFDLPVGDLTPRFFYCRQKVPRSHCGAGMVFGLNVGQDQFAQFQESARATGGAALPAPAAGKRSMIKKW